MGYGYTIKKVDGNHLEFKGYFEKFGCSVLDIHSLPRSADLLVGKNFKSIVVEIKDPRQSKSDRKLTKGESKFHKSWKGSIAVVETLSDVIDVVKALER